MIADLYNFDAEINKLGYLEFKPTDCACEIQCNISKKSTLKLFAFMKIVKLKITYTNIATTNEELMKLVFKENAKNNYFISSFTFSFETKFSKNGMFSLREKTPYWENKII